jgi:hypothetical protein
MSGMGPAQSAIRVTPEMEKQLETATPEMIKEIMRVAMLDQGLAVAPDFWHPEDLEPTPKAFNNPDAKLLTRRFRINGVDYELSGKDENEVNEQELALHRRLQSEPEQQDQPRDSQTGRFVSAEEQARSAELELRFKRGEISTDDYLTQSGAIERHLEAQGIDVASLREVSGRGFVQSWASAADEFLHSAEGASWPGGEENMALIARLLEENNLMDAENKREAIRAAVNFAREHAMLVTNPATDAANAIASADNLEDIRALSHRALGLPASGFFER